MVPSASSWDAFEPLRTLLVELAQERSLEALLPFIVGRLVEREEVALARVWLLGRGDLCDACPHRAACADPTRCLHLAASAARPRGGGPVVHTRLDGAFRRIPVGAFKVGLVAETGAVVVVNDPAHDPKIRHPEWIAAERIQGFAGQPLRQRGELLGVLGVFLRVPITPAALDVLRILANHVAVAIAAAQAFAQVERMQRLLQGDAPAPGLETHAPAGPAAARDRVDELVARSAAMQQVVREIAVVAPTDTTVLIEGESGTGKELIARAVHDRSARRERPYVAVNCAAVPRELYESEFFGHAKGSFSGAIRDRAGRFEAAEGGTLFLDEIGEMPLELQGKLLRALQEGTYERVGEARTRKADVRIVAATNRDLVREVESGRFRQDLYYRLNVFPIRVRPLRERREDIAPLAEALLAEIARRVRRDPIPLTPALLAALERHPWPGNVRELRNVLERALITSALGDLSLLVPANAAPAPPSPRAAPPPASTPPAAPPSVPAPPLAATPADVVSDEEMRRRERENILLALEHSGGKIYGPQGAAAILGLKPTTLASRLAKMNLRQGAGRRRG